MDQGAEQEAVLALFRDRKSHWASLTDEIESRGSALNVLEARVLGLGEQTELFGVDPDERLNLELGRARTALQRWAADGIRLVTLLDADYPAQLLTIHQRPPFLFYRGRLSPHDAGGVAVVGTRRPSQAGLARAAAIASGLAERGRTVISGLASGIDTVAHTSAIAVGGRTAAVIGTGLYHSYPKSNADLQQQIATEHVVVSQFWPDTGPSKSGFPMRNAVMSGYAAATVVIEAAWKSGARMQARLALEHGRPVFLHESLLEHDWARDYEARGAVVIDSAETLLTALDERLSPRVELVWS